MTLVVLGDLMVDVVAQVDEPLARGSDTPARVSVRGGGSAANVAAWAAARDGIRGKDITPYLLDRFHRETDGASLEANVRLVLRNAALAAQIARAVA